MITIQKYGKHENILIAEFGFGDIHFVGGSELEGGISSHLVFLNENDLSPEDRPLKPDTLKEKYKVTNNIPVKFVMIFRNSKSITALIHSLIEIQEQIQEEETTPNVSGWTIKKT